MTVSALLLCFFLNFRVFLGNYVQYYLQLNQVSLWGSMFVGSQSFLGSLGRNFFCSKFRKISINIKQMLIYTFVGV